MPARIRIRSGARIPTLIRAYGASRKGTSAVEFALVMPIFFMFVFGVMDFGRAFWTQAILQRGVDLTVRSALTQTYSNTVASSLQSACNSRIQSAGLGGYSGCSVSLTNSNTAVTVTASQPFSFTPGNIPNITITLKGAMSGPLAI